MDIIEITSSDILSPTQLENHFKVYAGPGAGKTHLLVNNIKHIITTNKKIRNSENKKVLCITYTNAAVDEIKARLLNYTQNVIVLTIHSFIIEYIIKPYQSELKKHILNDFGISISEKSFLTSQIEGIGILHGKAKQIIYDYINEKCGMNSEINYSKKIMGDVEINLAKFVQDESNLELKSSSRIEENHKKPIKQYLWDVMNKLNHDEILYFGYKMCTCNRIITYALRVQFPYTIVDEFQDTNPIQTKLIKHIGSKGTVIGVIGDKAQSIYSFQGAVPQEFVDFDICESIKQYSITGNRRSTEEIVTFCNFIRKSDQLVQRSIMNNKRQKIKILCGNGEQVIATSKYVISGDGAILTRTWAAAFKYIDGVDAEQAEVLKKIYNSYYNSPIDIRKEISEHNNVKWVRALRFIVSLQEALNLKSAAHLLKSLNYYVELDKLKKYNCITSKSLVQLFHFFTAFFELEVKGTDSIIFVFDKLNSFIINPCNHEIINLLTVAGTVVTKDVPLVTYSDEYEDDKLMSLLSSLEYRTGVKLFTEVFSENSKYMTVHQAKGREFEKVLVSVEPTRNDKVGAFIDMFLNPDTSGNAPAHEFARIFYVACSRAKNELYIHVDGGANLAQQIRSVLDQYASFQGIDEPFYEVVTC